MQGDFEIEKNNTPNISSAVTPSRLPENQGGGKKILSIVIGIVIVAIISSLFYFLVLPKIKPQKEEKAVLVYWGIWEDPSVFSQIIADYTRNNPQVEIRYEKQDIKNLGKYADRLHTRIQNGSGPDIFRYHVSWLPQVKGLLLPLPLDVVEESEIESKYYDFIESDLKVQGAYYGIPLGVDTLALFVNKDIFDKAGIKDYPNNWNDLIKVSRQLTVKDEQGKIKTSGVALGTYDNIAHSSDIMSLLFIQNGANFNNFLDEKTKKNAEDALDFYISFAQGDASVWDEALPNSKLAFAKGDLAMYFGYSWDIFEIQALNKDLKFAVVSVPGIPSEDKNIRNNTVASYWVEGVSVKTKYSKQAFNFLKYLSKKGTLQKLYTEQAKTRGFGEIYPRKDMASLLSSNKIIYPFVEQAPRVSKGMFYSDTYDEGMVDGLNAYLGNAIRSILLSSVSVQSSLETLSQGVDQILSRYQK